MSLLLLCPGLVSAAYITDNIQLDVYAQPFNQGAILTTVASGNQVEVLNSDGDYARITAPSNITGWIEAKYLSDVSNPQADLQALQTKLKSAEAELASARDKLAASQKSTVSDEELRKLQKTAKDAGWMRAELKKTRDRIKQLETAAKSTATASTNNQAELDKLRRDNAELETRLAAIMLIEQNTGGLQAAELGSTGTAKNADNTTASDDAIHVNLKLEWLLGSLALAIIVGIILGIILIDARMRKRHGGFRL